MSSDPRIFSCEFLKFIEEIKSEHARSGVHGVHGLSLVISELKYVYVLGMNDGLRVTLDPDYQKTFKSDEGVIT